MTDRTIDQIDREEAMFLSQPHPTQSHRANAKLYWEQQRAHAGKHFEDRWANLSNYQTIRRNGKPRAFGSEIVGTLRNHLVGLQKNRCCYCRRWLQNIAHARPVEHVLSRSDYPQFSVTYRNLAVACRDCNQLKADKKWGSLPFDAAEYPVQITEYFHPRFHTFDRHIRYVRVETNDSSIAIYHGLSEQGRQLCREHLKTISQVDGLMHNNRRFSTAISELQKAGETIAPAKAEKLNDFIDALHAAVRRLAESP